MRALPGQVNRVPPGAPPVTRDNRADQQRGRILQATAELVAKRGYHATTVELIVRRAKVGYSTFNKHFDSKESCLLGFLDVVVERVTPRISDAYRSEPGPWPDKVAAVLSSFFELIAEDPIAARVCLVEALTAGRAAVARYESAIDRFAAFLSQGRRLTPSGAQLPETVEETLAGGVLWMAYQRLVVGEADRVADHLAEAIEFVLSPYIGEDEAVRVASEFGSRASAQTA